MKYFLLDSGSGGNSDVLIQSRSIGNVNLVTPYFIEFEIKPLSPNKSAWSNILHAGTGVWDRKPAIWFHPGSTRLHVRISRHGHKYEDFLTCHVFPFPSFFLSNDGCDPGDHLAIGMWKKIRISVSLRRIQVYLDGSRKCDRHLPSNVFNHHGVLWA